MNRYMHFIYKCLYKSEKSNYICRNCKYYNNVSLCAICKGICLGVKVIVNNNDKDNISKDVSYY